MDHPENGSQVSEPDIPVLCRRVISGGVLHHLHAQKAYVLLYVHPVALSDAVWCSADGIPAACRQW